MKNLLKVRFLLAILGLLLVMVSLYVALELGRGFSALPVALLVIGLCLPLGMLLWRPKKERVERLTGEELKLMMRNVPMPVVCAGRQKREKSTLRMAVIIDTPPFEEMDDAGFEEEDTVPGIHIDLANNEGMVGLVEVLDDDVFTSALPESHSQPPPIPLDALFPAVVKEEVNEKFDELIRYLDSLEGECRSSAQPDAGLPPNIWLDEME